jgi:hypothetical protein
MAMHATPSKLKQVYLCANLITSLDLPCEILQKPRNELDLLQESSRATSHSPASIYTRELIQHHAIKTTPQTPEETKQEYFGLVLKSLLL